MDNQHTAVGVAVDDTTLVVTFDGGDEAGGHRAGGLDVRRDGVPNRERLVGPMDLAAVWHDERCR